MYNYNRIIIFLTNLYYILNDIFVLLFFGIEASLVKNNAAIYI